MPNMIDDQPLKTMSMPTNSPVTHSPDMGHCCKIRIPDTRRMAPSNAIQTEGDQTPHYEQNSQTCESAPTLLEFVEPDRMDRSNQQIWWHGEFYTEWTVESR